MIAWFSRFVSELKRRKVTRVGVVYAVVGIGTAEGAQLVFEALELPASASQAFTLAVLFGFPVALVLAWALEVTPEGIRRTQPAEAPEISGRQGAHWSSLAGWGIAVVVIGFAVWRLAPAGASTEAVLAAIADVEESLDRGELLEAYRKVGALPATVPDSTRQALMASVSSPHAFTTDPPGASVSWRPYAEPDAEWESLGTSPVEWQAPQEAALLSVEAEGYMPRTVMLWGGLVRPTAVTLRRDDEPDLQAVPVSIPQERVDAVMRLGDARLARAPSRHLGDFLIDRYEVTNRQYEEFVTAGGYEREQYWEEPFVREGVTLAWEDAVAQFVDQTDRPGPASWVGGTYPQEAGDHPVTGISWYEAMAYARFRGRTLPTLYHWFVTAFPMAAEWIVPLSNIAGDALAPVGTHAGVSPHGAYDMAGNAREWLVNATGDLRYTAGGGWNDRADLFSLTEPQSPFDRFETNGLRLMTHLGDPADFAAAAEPLDYVSRDYRAETPVSDEVFEAFRDLYAYDDLPLNARVEAVDTSGFVIRERITFDAAYDGPRMILHFFRPSDRSGPLQTILYMPGSGALSSTSEPGLGTSPSLLVRSGRAVALPQYMSTFERQDDYVYRLQDESADHRDHTIMWYQDLARSIDYLQTRPDVDSDRFGYLGVSWGGRNGNFMLALEERFRAAVLVVAGFPQLPTQPAADAFNFAPRVRLPVIMLNGEYDQIYPLEASASVMYDLLGTPEEDKAFYVAEGGHIIPTMDVAREMLNWFDRYIGPAR